MPTPQEESAGNRLIQLIRKEISKYHVDRFKAKETSSKVLGYLLAPFNPNYHLFNTMRYPEIYWADYPGRKESVERRDWSRTKTRAHEGVHMWDRKYHGWWFNVMYGAPHTFAPLFLIPFLIIGGGWAALSLLSMFVGLGLGYVLARKPWWFFSWLGLGVTTGLALSIWKTQWNTLWIAGFALAASPALNFLGAAYYRAWAEFRGYTMSLALNYWRYGSIMYSTTDWITKHFTGGNYYWMLPWKHFVERKLARQIQTIKDGSVLRDPFFRKVHQIMKDEGLLKQ